jgi:hypothetical protein
VVAAILFAYRARLTNRAEIIKSAPENERIQAIAATAEFFRLMSQVCPDPNSKTLFLSQSMRARRDLLLAAVTLIVAVLLAIVATVSILAFRPATSVTVVTQSGRGIASGHDTVINAPVTIGLTGEQIAAAQKPLAQLQEQLVL